MSSLEEQEALQKEASEGLVKAVQQRDVLFVLYHLPKLNAHSLNQQDSSTKLTPRELAFSLPHDCPRRALIVQLLVLASASLSLSEDQLQTLDGNLSDAVAASSVLESATEATTANMLLHDLSIEEAEIWLRDHGLDVEEAYASDNASDEEVQDSSLAPDTEGQDDHTPSSACGIPPSPSSIDPPSQPPCNVPSAPQAAARPLTEAHPTCQSFVVDCLADTTTLTDLEHFLHAALPSNLVGSVSPTFSSGTNAFKVSLSRAVEAHTVETLDNAKLDGANIRVQVTPLSNVAEIVFPTLPKQHSPPRSRSPLAEGRTGFARRRSLSPRRSTSRRRSPPPSSLWWERERQAQIWAPYSSCFYAYGDAPRPSRAPQPPADASQEELDHWAEESFVGRWAADYRGMRPAWVDKGWVWRGRLCPAFPPQSGTRRYLCWGRDCDNAHHQAELRTFDGELQYPELAAEFVKRPWKAPKWDSDFPNSASNARRFAPPFDDSASRRRRKSSFGDGDGHLRPPPPFLPSRPDFDYF